MNERTNTPFKRLFFALSLIPLVIPASCSRCHGSCWGREDRILNLMLQKLFDTDAVFINVYTMAHDLGRRPALFAMRFLLMTRHSLDGPVARRVRHDVRRLGATGRAPDHCGWRGAALASLLILFVRSLESFEVPACSPAAGIQVYTSSIYQAIHQYPSQSGLPLPMRSRSAHHLGRIYFQSRLSLQCEIFNRHRQGLSARVIDLGRCAISRSAVILFHKLSCCCRFWCWCGRRCRNSTAPRPGGADRLSLDFLPHILDYPRFCRS